MIQVYNALTYRGNESATTLKTICEIILYSCILLRIATPEIAMCHLSINKLYYSLINV